MSWKEYVVVQILWLAATWVILGTVAWLFRRHWGPRLNFRPLDIVTALQRGSAPQHKEEPSCAVCGMPPSFCPSSRSPYTSGAASEVTLSPMISRTMPPPTPGSPATSTPATCSPTQASTTSSLDAPSVRRPASPPTARGTRIETTLDSVPPSRMESEPHPTGSPMLDFYRLSRCSCGELHGTHGDPHACHRCRRRDCPHASFLPDPCIYPRNSVRFPDVA